MKHNSLADFTDKVTSKELFNITIKRITCVTLFKKVIVFPVVSVLMVECLHFAKSQKLDGEMPHAKSEKSAKIKMYYIRLSEYTLKVHKREIF